MASPRVTVRPRDAFREFLVLVGGPSNTFNGYTSMDPTTGDRIPQAKPETLADVRSYMGPPAGQSNPLDIGTHDLYWGNFIEPVHRLFKLGIAQPRPGDLVTVAIYLPPYLARAEIDWDASPHNSRWIDSPWVRGRDPYDSSVRRAEQGVQAKKDVPTQPKSRPGQARTPVSEGRVDHELLMRGTEPNKGNYVKRPVSPNHYLRILHDIPRRCVTGRQDLVGKPILPGVLVKLILVNDVKEFLEYVATGHWAGNQAVHVLDSRDEDDAGGVGIAEGRNWDYHAVGAVPRRAVPFWEQLPVIDREHVRICRFDYFGHSNPQELFLQYGLVNAKGEEPVGEVVMKSVELMSALRKGRVLQFTPDAEAHLWGCHLGNQDFGPPFALQLLPIFRKVTACDGFTSYAGVVEDEDLGMPVPLDDASFVEFSR